jgi:NADH-quinone oxidoreductase subunit G
MSDRTRWAFDGLTRQRLDSPLYKDPKTGNMKNVSWNESFDIVKEKF